VPLRLLRALLPLAAILVGGFALVHLWAGIAALRAGNGSFGALYGVLGVGGIALAGALVRLRRQLRPQAR
jgi:hypothetical protein